MYKRELHLPTIRPRVLEQTDAGPGVGVSNKQVQFRAVEKVCLEKLDFYTHVHLASGDCQNPVERTQAAVGKAMANGNRIHWEHEHVMESIDEKDKESLTIDEFNELECQRTIRNVQLTCQDLASQVQDSPGPKGSLDPMSGLTGEPAKDLFFNDAKFVHSNETHFEVGELYIEYRKGSFESRSGELCQFCCDNPWYGPKLGQVPKPMPNDDGGFLKYGETPTDGRYPDDYQPRAVLRKMFSDGQISSVNEDEVDAFSQTYSADKRLVTNELSHLELLKFKDTKRKKDRIETKEQENKKQFKDYDWEQLYKDHLIEKHWEKLYKDHLIEKQRLSVLDLFLQEKGVTVNGNKKEKIKFVMAFLAKEFASKDWIQYWIQRVRVMPATYSRMTWRCLWTVMYHLIMR